MAIITSLSASVMVGVATGNPWWIPGSFLVLWALESILSNHSDAIVKALSQPSVASSTGDVVHGKQSSTRAAD